MSTLGDIGLLMTVAGVGVWFKLTWPARQDGDEKFEKRSGVAGWLFVLAGLFLVTLDLTT